MRNWIERKRVWKVFPKGTLRASLWMGIWMVAIAGVRTGFADARGVSVNRGAAEGFSVFTAEETPPIIVDEAEEEVVRIAAEALAGDLVRLGGAAPELLTTVTSATDRLILVGSYPGGARIRELAASGKLETGSIDSGQWESYLIAVVRDPFPGVSEALVVAGSDPRGTAFGVFELSRLLGVSPWVWWADVAVEKREALSVSEGFSTCGPPSVKYRGIFINDEGWGLWPWASKTFDPALGDIGPKTYARVFELLLRLRANHIWPAMHPNTLSFYQHPENKEVAGRYGIVVGSSHAEPLLFNNAGNEWNERRDGPWNYMTNRDRILEVLGERVAESAPFENIYTVGLRGIHDSGMVGVGSAEEGARLLNRIIRDERELLARHRQRPADEIPQVFIPYKEVLRQYDTGLVDLPEDITLMWPDDNFGFIRRFPDAAERDRSGSSGVYYHLSYLGAPHPYLWLSPKAPSMIWREMRRAWLEGVDRVWIGNVGDIKRREWQMEFFLDLAWDPDSWSPERVSGYFREVAARDIGAERADAVGELMEAYYRLAIERKPEHMGFSRGQWAGWTPVEDPEFSLWAYGDEAAKRLDAYNAILDRARAIYEELPEKKKDAFFQLVYYPIAGATAMNEKLLQAYRSREYARQGRVAANSASDRAFDAFERIIELTRHYNEEVADGKWRHSVIFNPGFKEGSRVFFEPETSRVEVNADGGVGVAIEGEAHPLRPVDGALPPVATTGSRISLDPSEAVLSGELELREEGEAAFLIWPGTPGDDRVISGPGSWSAIPHVVDSPTKAVFDFYYDGTPGGRHTLYLSVDHPDATADSWWLTLNNYESVSVNDRIGRIERLRVADYVLRRGWNRLVIHPRETGGRLYGVRLVQEAVAFQPEYASGNRLPMFNRYTRNRHFIDIFSRGTTGEWTAETRAPWILLSANAGVLGTETDRIWVDIDYDNVPTGRNVEGEIILAAAGWNYRVEVGVFNEKLDLAEGAHIETNGVISIEARHFAEARAGVSGSWREMSGLGRTGGAMILEPMTGWYVENPSDIVRKSPVLVYELAVLEGGVAEVELEALPAFPLRRDQPLRCAIGVDDGEPVWVTFDMGLDGEGSGQWQENVLENRMTGSVSLNLPAGDRRLKIWGTDPSINLERIFIDFGGRKASYLGPPETRAISPDRS